MKIIQIISNLNKGGAERLTVDLSNILSKNNNLDILLVVYNEDKTSSFRKELDNKVRFINLNKKLKLDIFFQINLFKLLITEKPDIVHSHLSGTLLYLYIPILFLKKIRFLHTIHNIAEEELPNRLLQKIRKIYYINKKIIPISISETTKASHVELYQIDSPVIKNGIIKKPITCKFELVKKEINYLKINKQTKVFLSIGRINSSKDQKNYKLLVDVFNQLHENKINVILIIIGADTSLDQHTLKALMKYKSINTYFIGSKDNITDYMLNSDCYCLSSKFEGLPITIIEALSNGLPIISTNVGGVSELIKENFNGLLVNDLSVESYYNKIIELLEWNETKRQQIAKNNTLDFEANFDIAITAKNYINLYNSFLKAHKTTCVV